MSRISRFLALMLVIAMFISACGGAAPVPAAEEAGAEDAVAA